MVFRLPAAAKPAPGVDRGQATDYAAEIFSRLLPVLEATGVTVALEPLGPEETNFLVTTAEAVELAERIGSPHVRLHLDCKAMATEAVPAGRPHPPASQALGPFPRQRSEPQGPGFGQLDFRPIFEALGEIDYSGWVSVEVFDDTPGIECLARQSIQYMLKCLSQLAQ